MSSYQINSLLERKKRLQLLKWHQKLQSQMLQSEQPCRSHKNLTSELSYVSTNCFSLAALSHFHAKQGNTECYVAVHVLRPATAFLSSRFSNEGEESWDYKSEVFWSWRRLYPVYLVQPQQQYSSVCDVCSRKERLMKKISIYTNSGKSSKGNRNGSRDKTFPK